MQTEALVGCWLGRATNCAHGSGGRQARRAIPDSALAIVIYTCRVGRDGIGRGGGGGHVANEDHLHSAYRALSLPLARHRERERERGGLLACPSVVAFPVSVAKKLPSVK